MLLVTALLDRLSVLGGSTFVGASRKRKVSSFASMVSNERLEDRALLSAVIETGASVAADVSPAKATAKPTFPALDKAYTATVEGTLPVDPGTGTATITQKSVNDSSVKAVITFSSVGATFNFTGKFGKLPADATAPVPLTGNVTGKIKIPGSKASLSITGSGTASVSQSDTSSVDVMITVKKDVKVGGQVVVAKGTQLTLHLTKGTSAASITATNMSKKPASPDISGKFTSTLADTADGSGVINLSGTTVVTSKGSSVKAIFTDDTTGAVAKFSGKFSKGSTDTVV